MADNYAHEIKTALENNDRAQAAKKALEYLDMSNNISLNVAITGESGSGKSTLVNALRGIRNNTEGAAPTGAVETTMEPTEYIHPEHPNIKIWDLPGIGTVKFTADKYIKKMEFEKYDFFIIVSSERFRENDAKLAKEIQKMKKKFYFVRSKIDHSIRDEKEGNPNVEEEEVLNDVRTYSTKELQKLGFESPKIFLVSGLSLHLYEFKDLWKTLEADLPELQRDALLLALPNISLDVIEQKKQTLGRKIIWFTLASAAVAAVPVPGLSEGVDLGIIVTFTSYCLISLGLTPELLQKLSNVHDVPLSDLLVMKSPFTGVKISPALVMKVLTGSAAFIVSMVAEEGARFVPLVGIPIAMALSSVTTYKALKYILNLLSEDAHQLFIKIVMAEQCTGDIQTALENNDQTRAVEKNVQESTEKVINTVNIAIVGESGSGKTTLVSALRGTKNKEDRAAPTGVKEMDGCKIWDLPGLDTVKLKPDKYMKKMEFEKYDFFIIVSSDIFKENYVKLAKGIQKMKKKFYFVRSKIDQKIPVESEENPNVKEQVLDSLRNSIICELQDRGFESPKVFLVSGLRLHLYEFKHLCKALKEEHETIMSDKCKVEIQTAIQNNNLTLAAKISLDYLNQLKNVHLNIAITGESGSGKSTLVNALRGIRNKTEGAAPTGVKETTMEPTEYTHPKNKKIRLWDLPGIGTTKFPADKYLEHVGFEKYDFFIIVSCDRFTENDAKLAKEIQKMKKKFYFVRSKIDHSIRDEKDSDPNLNEENLLKDIKDDCIKKLEQLNIESPKVFLVSGVSLHLYEIEDLWKTLQEELPELKRDVLLLALPNISTDIIEQKKKTLESKIVWYTVASVAGELVPIPGLSERIDLSIITAFTEHCVNSLGLTPESLQKLSDVSRVPLCDLREELKSPLAGVEITKGQMTRFLNKSSIRIIAVETEEGVMVGTFVEIPPIAYPTYKILKYILNSLAEDAQRVFKKAMNTSV